MRLQRPWNIIHIHFKLIKLFSHRLKVSLHPLIVQVTLFTLTFQAVQKKALYEVT